MVQTTGQERAGAPFLLLILANELFIISCKIHKALFCLKLRENSLSKLLLNYSVPLLDGIEASSKIVSEYMK